MHTILGHLSNEPAPSECDLPSNPPEENYICRPTHEQSLPNDSVPPDPHTGGSNPIVDRVPASPPGVGNDAFNSQ